MKWFQRFKRWFSTPQSSPDIDPKNFVNVQIDAIGVGLANAASPFLPVFLTRLNATSFQVGLLTSMPAFTGLLLALPLGRLLQKQRNIVPWFSATRLGVIACYALTGLVTFILPEQYWIIAILAIWALATIPQTVLAICFSVVMNQVAGPKGRFELMTRRWSLLGLTTTTAVILIGQLLEKIAFPFNYRIAFLAVSIGGLISFYFSSHIRIPETVPTVSASNEPVLKRLKGYFALITSQKAFTSFMIKRFIFWTGTTLATPLFPLYFVRVVHADDSWIAAINTAQTAILVLGYFFWSRQSRVKGTRNVLVWTTLGLSIYPLLVSSTQAVGLITVIAGAAGIFQAGLDLVFFDELMRTVPVEYSATFVSFAQAAQYLTTVISPIIGTTLADAYGLGFALIVSASIRFLGFLLFWLGDRKKVSAAVE